jgi:RNA polymerase sigma factor (sigma-70 family)
MAWDSLMGASALASVRHPAPVNCANGAGGRVAGQVRDAGDAAVAGQQAQHRSAAELLTGVTHGEWAAWHEIISRYGRLVIHTATKVGLNHSDAADVAQLTWLRLWQHGHQVREPGCIAAWLVSTARREATRLAAASSRYVLCADPSAEHSWSDRTAIRDVYRVEQGYDHAVERALDRLPARYRTLLRLLSSDLGLSYSEVADRMGLPIGSIGPMRMRAIRMLRKTPEFIGGTFPGPAMAGAAT